MQLEFGCGETPTRPGYSTSDIRDLPGIDYVCPAWEINQHVKPNTVTHIWSRHFLEHLTFPQGRMWLRACLDILVPGGEQTICVPNMRFHVQQWLNGNALEHARAGFWGWQREGETELWDVHKSGYTDEQLIDLVSQIGYVGARSTKKQNHKHLEVVCYKE